MPHDSATESVPTLVTVQQATNIVLSVAKRLSPVTIPLHDALWAVLAEDVVAPEPLPPFPASIKVCCAEFWIQRFSLRSALALRSVFQISHIQFP